MQNRSNKKLIAGIVMVVAILAVGIMAVVADRAPVPVSSSESKEEMIWDEPEEISSSSVESAPESESAAESVPEEEPDSALDEENALSEEVSSSEAASESASSSKEESSSSSSTSSSSSSSSSTASSAAHSQAASSHETASSSHAASSSAASSSASASAESAVDKQIDSYVSQLTNLRQSSQKELYGIIGETYTEYVSHPEEERSIALKVSIVVSKTAKLNSAQSRCDKEFNAILKELRQYLKDNGRDQSIADEAEATYKEQKSAMTKELTDIVYNSATGSGDGGSWIVDHIPS